jgi:hypothetical protein
MLAERMRLDTKCLYLSVRGSGRSSSASAGFDPENPAAALPVHPARLHTDGTAEGSVATAELATSGWLQLAGGGPRAALPAHPFAGAGRQGSQD